MRVSTGDEEGRGRIRDVIPSLRLGRWPTGLLNSITDVPGVLVHTESIQPDRDVNTGVTTILPRKDWDKFSSFAGIFRFNGFGEMTGTHWIEEGGLLSSPIILCTTSFIGDAIRGVADYCYKYLRNEDGEMTNFLCPVVAETYDGFLNDHSRFPLTSKHIERGILNASSDRVPEGNTGGGTGMICHRFKGGTGSSSRVVKGLDVDGESSSYTVGVLVQANYGAKADLRIGGVPVGQILLNEDGGEGITEEPDRYRRPQKDGSIIIIIATDAPLLPGQLQRLAKRATVGLSKVGSYGHNTSGDIFLAFSTANSIPQQLDVAKVVPQEATVKMIDNESISTLFEAVADATEEAIYNALFMAEDMVGFKGREVNALPLQKVEEIVEKRL